GQGRGGPTAGRGALHQVVPAGGAGVRAGSRGGGRAERRGGHGTGRQSTGRQGTTSRSAGVTAADGGCGTRALVLGPAGTGAGGGSVPPGGTDAVGVRDLSGRGGAARCRGGAVLGCGQCGPTGLLGLLHPGGGTGSRPVGGDRTGPGRPHVPRTVEGPRSGGGGQAVGRVGPGGGEPAGARFDGGRPGGIGVRGGSGAEGRVGGESGRPGRPASGSLPLPLPLSVSVSGTLSRS